MSTWKMPRMMSVAIVHTMVFLGSLLYILDTTQPLGPYGNGDQPGLGTAGDHPLRDNVPQIQLLLHPAFDGVTRHHTPQNPTRRRQTGPVTFFQGFNVFKKLSATGQQRCTHARCIVKGPLQAGVANVQGQKCHARIMTTPTCGGLRTAA